MSINVYWACAEKNIHNWQDPINIAKNFYSSELIDPSNPYMAINRCPVFNENLINLYGLSSFYNCSFDIIDNDIKFFNNTDYPGLIVPRSIDRKFFSFMNSYIFFTDHDSLNTTFYEHPYLEDNQISNRCMIVSGQYDIGKWLRNTEFAFFLKKEFTGLEIKREDIYSYIRFHTKEKINFIQFHYSDFLRQYVSDATSNSATKKMKSMMGYYSIFKHKKMILKEIKNNVL